MSAIPAASPATTAASWVIKPDGKWVVAVDQVVEVHRLLLDRLAVHGQVRPLDDSIVQRRQVSLLQAEPLDLLQVLLVQADPAGVLYLLRGIAQYLFPLSLQVTSTLYWAASTPSPRCRRSAPRERLRVLGWTSRGCSAYGQPSCCATAPR